MSDHLDRDELMAAIERIKTRMDGDSPIQTAMNGALTAVVEFIRTFPEVKP
jgi:hypothetical protein